MEEIDFLLTNFSFILELVEINLMKCLEDKFYTILEEKSQTIQVLNKRLEQSEAEKIGDAATIEELNKQLSAFDKENSCLREKLQKQEKSLAKIELKSSMKMKRKSVNIIVFEEKEEEEKMEEIKTNISRLKKELQSRVDFNN